MRSVIMSLSKTIGEIPMTVATTPPNDLSIFWLIYAIIVIVFLSMYGYLQKQGLTIGSGSVESSIKQIELVVGSRFLALSGIETMLLKF